MVRLGFTRAYGTKLRAIISSSTDNRFKAFLSGLCVTTILQSSTATAFLLSSFAKRGLIGVSAGLAVMLGADVGTTIVVQILSFDLSWLMPVLITLGVVMHMMYQDSGRQKHIARIFIGLGLMLLALYLISQSAAVLSQSELLPILLQPLMNELLLAVIFSALLTVIMHSSLTTILFYVSLLSAGIINFELTLVLILGANIGGSIIPVLATQNSTQSAFRIPVANLGVKSTGAFLALPFLGLYPELLDIFTADPVRQAVTFHTAFNVALALLALPFTGPIASLVEKKFPDKVDKNNPATPLYLDQSALHAPVIALAGAARETMRMAEMLQDMLKQTISCFETDDKSIIKSIRSQEEVIDQLYKEIKFYLTRLSREELDPKEADRYIQVVSFATNLEHMGDILDKSLLDLAEKKIRKQQEFSQEGFKEIKSYHNKVLKNMQMAQTIFLSEDPDLARKLVAGKKALRKAEIESASQHFKRLQKGKKETLATSSLHLDIIRDYRRINSHITAVAYAIMDNAEAHEKERK